MNQLVKILSSDDGTPREIEDQVWHYVDYASDCDRTLCEGEVFGLGEGECKYETKTVKKGGITCPRCLDRIKKIKAIKL